MSKRRKKQGIDHVVGGLKKLMMDSEVPARIRLEALDRLAFIDKIYNVGLRPHREHPVPPTAKTGDPVVLETGGQKFDQDDMIGFLTPRGGPDANA